MRHGGARRRRVTTAAMIHAVLVVCGLVAGVGLLALTLRSVEPSETKFGVASRVGEETKAEGGADSASGRSGGNGSCATVEEMGTAFGSGEVMESLRVRRLIWHHFDLHGASRVRQLPPEQFCKRGFVIGKAYQAGFGNEMYKLLTAAALSVMLNRSLIIGQTRGRYPFGDYISYSSEAFTLREVKQLWRRNDCIQKYGRDLVVRFDDFQKPSKSGVLCSNWLQWEQSIIWFDSTTDAVGAQFFLKNVHPEMRNTASNLFGDPENLESRPNVFGEIMRVLISPSEDVQEAVNWVLKGGLVPDLTLHMRMLMNSSIRAVHAALECVRKALKNLQISRPRLVLVSDTPSFIEEVTPLVNEFAEVLHFNYEAYRGNISGEANVSQNLDFRAKDWGPAPRWVAFVDFFLASRSKHAVVSGAHRRVGTTYAQLIAALAAANKLDESDLSSSSLLFLSSFQHSLLSEGLSSQIGWGHVWNRFSGPLSCRNQSNQCAPSPFLPPAWWDGIWQSPTQRDIHRLQAYGVQLSGLGTFDPQQLHSYCNSRKQHVTTLPVSRL
uniref:Uncharacterized protein n=1 Tax=Kalanchoe fedtschenkoi TaxID=63787 RepID=A0A7N0UQA3_KALFE